jgi:SAM-dependent methyltransferase
VRATFRSARFRSSEDLGWSGTDRTADLPLMAGHSDRYLLGVSGAEVEHLVRQAEVYADEAGQLLDRVGVTAGAAVIDVGCGVLGIVDLLRAKVGPRGRVVGVDREPRMLDVARQVAAQRGLPVEFVLGDATDLVLPSDSFDLVHERTVLLNIADPARVVAEMIRIARPGGVIALQEPDSSAWVCDPPHPAWDLLHAELLDAYRRNGKDFDRDGALRGCFVTPGLLMSRCGPRRGSRTPKIITRLSCLP